MNTVTDDAWDPLEWFSALCEAARELNVAVGALDTAVGAEAILRVMEASNDARARLVAVACDDEAKDVKVEILRRLVFDRGAAQ